MPHRAATARRFLAPLVGLLALAACQAPRATAPDPTGRANAEMREVLTELAALNPKPLPGLTPTEARLQPGAADAALRVQRARTGSVAPQRVDVVQNMLIPGAVGPLPARLYNPRPGNPRRPTPPLPVILYFGGGGWVIADLDTYDASARALADGTGAIVVSVMYRRGPENRFPAAHEDAVTAYAWLQEGGAASIGGDPKRLALAGESAGGNLAIATAVAARDAKLTAPLAQLLVYPVAGTRTDTPSARENRDAKPLSTADLPWFLGNYTSNSDQLDDPRLNPALLVDLRGLPPATVILAEIDPLRSGGEVLADRLRAFGVPVEARTFPGVTHEFFGMGAVLADARTAQGFAADRLRAALAPPPAEPRSRARRRGA